MSRQEKSQFIVSQEDWSLHRKGYDDQQRHQKKSKRRLKIICRILLQKKASSCRTEKML